MLGKANSGMILGRIKVSCPNNATVTVSMGSDSYTKTGTSLDFFLSKLGTWTIKATYNGLTETYTRTVTAGQTVTLTVLNNIHIYSNQSYLAGFSGTFNGWQTAFGQTYEYNAIQDNHVHAQAANQFDTAWARSTKGINLTGIKYVRFGFNGVTGTGSGGDGKFAIHVTDANGNLLAESGYMGGGDQEYPSQNIDLDVRNVNRVGYFQIYAQRWGSGFATINLHNLWLRS